MTKLFQPDINWCLQAAYHKIQADVNTVGQYILPKGISMSQQQIKSKGPVTATSKTYQECNEEIIKIVIIESNGRILI